MSQWSQNPPQLCPMSQCDASLDFSPCTQWPLGLPAVAVNQTVFAGFSQELVFNHQLDPSDLENIASLFRSLYFELSFAEVARLIEKAKGHAWFPLTQVIAKLGWQSSDTLLNTADRLRQTPIGFQNWCAEKKLTPGDLAPLLKAENLNLKYLFLDLLNFELSRRAGSQALETTIDLLLLNHKAEDLHSSRLLTLIPKDQTAGEAWLEALLRLRHPDSFVPEAEKWTSLPWPGMSEAKWIRQGSRGGIELKLFVSQPSDLKRYLQSLSKVQELMEKGSSASGTEH